MTPNRPYLIRAINEWLLDNQTTPYLLVDANADGVEVPDQFIQDGKIVLNISPQAVEALRIGNDEITFLARFGGVSQMIAIPMPAVLAIYARENGRGMMFNEEEGEPPAGPDGDDSAPPPSARPSLKVVK